ncbi:MAG TPA: hypothetical protein VLS27_20015 [Gammaproteobacteria bacterium]|nr:hypothetical protein [Gammaproteobacteria bacterium]
MKIHALSKSDAIKALGVGIVNSLLLSAVMVPVFKLGISPMPKPPSLAFAESVFGRALPLPVGLLFHVAYATGWTVVFVVLFRDRLSFLRALGLALMLWIIALVIFFPVNGWGFLGLAVSPKLIVAALIPHVLFAVFLWALCRMSFK